MRGQSGFWDIDERYVRLSEAGDPLEKLTVQRHSELGTSKKRSFQGREAGVAEPCLPGCR